MFRDPFWRLCVVWALLLGSFAALRPYLFPLKMSLAEGFLPAAGERVDIPPFVTSVDGARMPGLEPPYTLFLVVSASCAACRRATEDGALQEVLIGAGDHGWATRILLLPADPFDTQWYVDQLGPHTTVVLDTASIAQSRLRARITPSVIVLDGTGEVVFSRQWPLTWQVIARDTGA